MQLIFYTLLKGVKKLLVMSLSDLLMQYQSECLEAFRSSAKISKPFEKVLMETLKLRFSVKVEMQHLLDLVHFFTFTCHGSLNLWLICKVNEQVGGHAPKSGAAASLARAFLIRFYRFLGGYELEF